ncbi:MAG TPA: cytochrome c [Alphaproteobacteria bacterium]|nr:cytochrome c [Alphaproteobacteria bacterium]
MKRLVKRVVILGAVGVVTAWATAVLAADMGKVIEYRRNVMKAIGAHAADIVLILKGEVPFGASDILAHAEAINAMSKLVPALVPPGSGPEAGDTNAKPEIWQNMDKFKADAERLQTESAKLVEVAKSGDMKAIGAQVAVLGKEACGACHKEFRKPLKQ